MRSLVPVRAPLAWALVAGLGAAGPTGAAAARPLPASPAAARSSHSPSQTQSQQPPPAVPQPFPQPTTSGRQGQSAPPPARPATTAASPDSQREPATSSGGSQSPTPPPRPGSGPPAPTEAPTAATLGHPIFPEAQFLASYNAGQGQRYYIFGAAASFTQVVNFYRTALKARGDVVFEEPPTIMFETGRYREDTMAFPPGVTVKDYTWGNSEGYLNPKPGAQPARFPTVIQIVAAPSGQP